mmetsp:Transcript_14368/g.28973  ORF Transcript_14368/g.28973 Transcript_14368/m.28973 type:complete len:146 (-) Transcript_14368:1617-2054(-)
MRNRALSAPQTAAAAAAATGPPRSIPFTVQVCAESTSMLSPSWRWCVVHTTHGLDKTSSIEPVRVCCGYLMIATCLRPTHPYPYPEGKGGDATQIRPRCFTLYLQDGRTDFFCKSRIGMKCTSWARSMKSIYGTIFHCMTLKRTE